MASSDARPMPLKNTAFRVTFPILDADGDLVTGATGLDSEVSKDGGTFADCTNEATEIATSSGMYYLDLTSTEMNADTVALIIKTSTSGAKTTPIVLYPVEATDISVNVTAWNGTAIPGVDTAGYPKVTVKSGTGAGELSIASGVVSADAVQLSGDAAAANNAESFFDGTGYAGTNNVIPTVTTVNGLAAGAITAAAIATGAIDADALAADAIDEIWDEVLEGSLTGRQIMRIFMAALAGKSSGGGTSTINFRDNADSKNRISATVDSNRNRTAVTLDGS